MQKKSKQEASARYRKKLSTIVRLEKSRDQLTNKELTDLVDVNLKEARDSGIDIIVDFDKETKLYAVSVRGEEGTLYRTLRNLPSTINGLRLMGRKLRGILFDHQKKLQSKTK